MIAFLYATCYVVVAWLVLPIVIIDAIPAFSGVVLTTNTQNRTWLSILVLIKHDKGKERPPVNNG